jgi:UDP-N-acetylmuramoylalanine-D-glutamate ligase
MTDPFDLAGTRAALIADEPQRRADCRSRASLRIGNGTAGGRDQAAQAQMLAGQPDLVVANPGGRGTANMVKQAREVGVRVVEAP